MPKKTNQLFEIEAEESEEDESFVPKDIGENEEYEEENEDNNIEIEDDRSNQKQNEDEIEEINENNESKIAEEEENYDMNLALNEDIYEDKLIEIYDKTKLGEINDELFYNFNNYNIYELKLSNLASVQTNTFNKETFEPEPTIKIQDDKGKNVEKRILYDNFIRWKNLTSQKEDANTENSEINDFFNLKSKLNNILLGNSQLILLSDDTYKLKIGNNIFDINIADSSNLAFSISNNDNYNVIGGKLQNKILLKKSYFDMFSSKRKSSVSYEDYIKNDNPMENNVKTKLFHSYFDKNKFTREEYMSKSGKINVVKNVDKLHKKELIDVNVNLTTNNIMLNKKRKNMQTNDFDV